LIIKSLTVGPIQANCFILGCEETLEAAVIDPNSYVPGGIKPEIKIYY